MGLESSGTMAVAYAQSNASSGRGGYFRGGRSANVDETLFGAGGHQTQARMHSGKEISITGKDTVMCRKRIDRMNNGGASKADAVVIAASELNRLRDNAKLLTKEEELEQKRIQEAAYAERMAKSVARKEKIRQMEKERKKNVLLADKENNGRAQKNSVLERRSRCLTRIWMT